VFRPNIHALSRAKTTLHDLAPAGRTNLAGLFRFRFFFQNYILLILGLHDASPRLNQLRRRSGDGALKSGGDELRVDLKSNLQLPPRLRKV
jgi:hypothetical protein